jgi:phytoene synthase
LAGVLRSVPALAGQGRCLLPLETLAAAGLSAEAVVAAPEQGPVRDLVAAIAEAALPGLAETRAALRIVPREAVAGALSFVLARRDLRRLATGRAIPAARGLGDRLAVSLAGLRGRV